MCAIRARVETRRSRNGRAIPRPFLKWVGGKTQLLGALRELIPRDAGSYFEPFLGGGALFFDRRPRRAVLADLNPELIDAFTAVRDDVEELMEHLRGHVYDKGYFYEVRSRDRGAMTLPERAARTIFLNRTGFNGLYRVNQKGLFNVPFGRYKDPTICDSDNLLACSAVLKGTELRSSSFEVVLADAGKGDFVYLDPPYVPVSRTANFTAYTRGGFGPADQDRLAQCLVELDERGACFVLSNADTPEVRAMYERLGIAQLQIDTVLANRSVNSRVGGRGKVGELLVRNFS
jgi:DNA adenine methylase